VWRLALLLPLLAACVFDPDGPGISGEVPGLPGIARPINEYYYRFGVEENGRCRAPQVVAYFAGEVLEDTPERLVVRVRYQYRDDAYDTESPISGFVTCRGRGERRFVLDKDGETYTVVRMSGPSSAPQTTGGTAG
jgi:hypothetical protein